MKKNLLIIAFIILITIPLLLFLTRRSPTSTPVSPTSPTPTPFLEQTSTDRFINQVARPTLLSESTQDKKEDILLPIGGESGILEDTPRYQIVYLKSPDVFQIEIKSEEIERTKSDSLLFFTQAGFTQNEICSLKIMYLLSFDLLLEYKKTGQTFNVLAQGC